jgi:hypothetical protein
MVNVSNMSNPRNFQRDLGARVQVKTITIPGSGIHSA